MTIRSRKTILLVAILLVWISMSIPAVVGAEASAVHVVQRGETLGHIAQNYNVSIGTLAASNSIADPNRIYAGQRLVIPGCTPSPPPPPPPPPPWPPWPGPGPQPIQCEITPVMGFGRVWTNNTSVRQKLGCPQAQEFSVGGE